jgi:hypothetical protein
MFLFLFFLREFVFLERRLFGPQAIRQEIRSNRRVESHPPDHSFFHTFYLNKNDFISRSKTVNKQMRKNNRNARLTENFPFPLDLNKKINHTIHVFAFFIFE